MDIYLSKRITHYDPVTNKFTNQSAQTAFPNLLLKDAIINHAEIT